MSASAPPKCTQCKTATLQSRRPRTSKPKVCGATRIERLAVDEQTSANLSDLLAISVSSSLKRHSPIIEHRAAKIRPVYMGDRMMSPNDGHRSNELMSPEINSMLRDERVHIRSKHDDG